MTALSFSCLKVIVIVTQIYFITQKCNISDSYKKYMYHKVWSMIKRDMDAKIGRLVAVLSAIIFHKSNLKRWKMDSARQV